MINTRTHKVCLMALLCLLQAVAHAQAGNSGAIAQITDEGQRNLAQGHIAAAQEDFEKLAKLEPGVAEVHATLAALCYQQHEYEEAIREVRTAQRLKPGLPKLDSLLALSLAETGDLTRALPGLEKGFRQTADREVRRMCGLELLHAYMQLHRDLDAVEVAVALNRYFPDDPEVLYHTGRVYGNQAYVAAMQLHDKAPNSVWMLQAQGEANESEKNFDASLTAFRNELEIDPQRRGIHYRMGRVYLTRYRDGQKAEDRKAAADEFAAELAMDPDNGNARYELGVLAAEDNNLDAARQYFDEVLKRFPDFEEALVGLAGCDLQMQKAADAVAALEHAIKLRPDDEVAWYRLARARQAMGERDEALKAMMEFRRIHEAAQQTSSAPAMTDQVTPQALDANANSQ